jgi:signal transduction histidine kinase
LALQSEVELLTNSEETQKVKTSILKRCDTIFSRVDELHRATKTNQLNLKYCPVETVIEQTLEHFTYKLSKVTLAKNFTNKHCIAFIDPVYIEQALHNILHNAFDAMENMPENQQCLSIGLTILNRWIQIIIKDSGKGISPDNLLKIFLPFYSSHAYSKHWGVGLTLTYKIIHAHGGKIQVDSKLSEGTRFEILLPYANHLHERKQFTVLRKELKQNV